MYEPEKAHDPLRFQVRYSQRQQGKCRVMDHIDLHDVSVKRTAMKISYLDESSTAQKPFAQGCDTDGNLLSARDTNVALSKSPERHVPAGVGAGSAKPKVALISEDKGELSCAIVTDSGSGAAAASHLVDCSTLTAMQLRKKHKPEADSHRNMLRREKTHGREIDRRFRRFSDFLSYVGPKPTKSATPDRIDNTDPEYAPGKVRWADARTQNNNKGDTLVFRDPATGEHYTTSRLAKLRGVPPSTIRKRRERGWSDTEAITGKRSTQSHPAPVLEPKTASPEHVLEPPLDVTWRKTMSAAYPGEWHHLTPRDKGTLKSLAETLAHGGLAYQAEEVLDHAIRNWERVTAKTEQWHGAFNTPERPTIAFLLKYEQQRPGMRDRRRSTFVLRPLT